MRSTEHWGTERGSRGIVELRLPADGAFVSVVRTTTAGLAARLDFPIDDIEDLRIAVGEACAMVLAEARPASEMTCRFHLGHGEMTVEVGVETDGTPTPDYDSFAWQVLHTLASSASAEARNEAFTVRMTMHSGADL